MRISPAEIDNVPLHIDYRHRGGQRIELEHTCILPDSGPRTLLYSIIPSLRFLRPSRMLISPEPEALGLHVSSCSSAGRNPLERSAQRGLLLIWS